MKRILSKAALIVILLLSLAFSLLLKKAIRLEQERNRYRQNTEALMADMLRIQVDSSRMAVDVHALRLSVFDFERYRAEDAALIKTLGIRIRNLEAAAKHTLSVDAPITAPVIDSVIIHDTVRIAVQTVEMVDPYIRFKGIIEDEVLSAHVHLPVNLNQAVWVEYRRRFPWIRRRVKAVHQTITSDNPYVEITYSEYINIGK